MPAAEKSKIVKPIWIEWAFLLSCPISSEMGFFIEMIDMTQAKEKLRTVTFLSREQIDFLDKLGKDALFYQSIKLSRAQTLSELVNLLMDLGVNIKNLDLNEETLAQGLLRIINNHCQGEKNE